MFDDLRRQLRRIPGHQSIPISLTLDDDGYLDRACPAPECGAAFKVMFEDWRDKVPDEQAWCAVCGETAGSSEWNSPAQQEQIRAQAVAHLTDQLDDAFRRARKPKASTDGLISMTWSYKPGARPMVVVAEAEPAMTARSTCEACDCAYASVGAAFFCPACGHNSAASTFAGSLATIRASMDLADDLPRLMGDRDTAANTARHLAEASLGRVWTSFQRLAEVRYAATPASATAPATRNAFQRLGDSDRFWSGAIGKTYRDFLDTDEHRDLVRLVAARHVLAHPDGFVDGDYVARSGDARYAVGQRLVVTTAEVRRFCDLAEKLAAGLAAGS